MSKICLSQVVLAFVGGGSDKLYVVQVEQDTAAGSYRAVGYYGRRGASLSETVKYDGPNKASAESAARTLQSSKTSKGYTISPMASVPGMPASAPLPGSTPATTASPAAPTAAPAAPAVQGPAVMLAEVADEAMLEVILESSDWVLQKKYDGERVPVSLRRDGVQAFNRKRALRPLTSAVDGEFKRLIPLPDFNENRQTLFDGELMGDEYVIYDVLVLRDNDVTKLPFVERFSLLEALLESRPGLLAQTAWTTEEKRQLLDEARTNAWEGVIARHINAPYVGGRVKNLLKHKLWATVTCRVLTANAQRSVQLALLDETGSEVFVGNVTIPPNQDVPEPDSLVEIRYLYAMEGGSLYQPCYLRPRDDIDEADKRSSLRQAPPEKRTAEAT